MTKYDQQQKEQIVKRLVFDNPWWSTGKIADDFDAMPRRPYIDLFYPIVADLTLRRAAIIMGPRRVGKTVMIYHTIKRLIDSGVDPQKIIYMSIDTPIYSNVSLDDLFSYARAALHKEESGGFFVFYDEIQYLKDWEVNLKSLVDTYKSVKFIASGSAAAELQKKSNESGAGRFTDFSLPPLTFYEYIHLRGYTNIIQSRKILWYNNEIACSSAMDIDKLNGLLLDYINYGGYPEVVFSQKIRENPGQFIRHDIIDKVLLRDLPSLYGITDVQELNSVFTMIAYHSGGQFSYETLAKESGVKKDTLRKYIQYLQAAFLIKVVRRTDDTAKNYQRETQFKIYLTNPSLRCALFQPIKEQDEEIGDMVETAVYAQWIPRTEAAISYANWKVGRTQGEVDIVGINVGRQKPAWAVEIKWTDRFFERPGELVSLKYFMEKNNMREAIVTTRTQQGTKVLEWGSIHYIPVACYVYTVGENTLRQVQENYGL